MRVAVDLRVLSTPAAERGMGRYTRQVVSALAAAPDVQIAGLLFPEAHATLVRELEQLGVEMLDVTHDWMRRTHWTTAVALSEQLEGLLRTWRADVFIDATPFIHPPRLDLGDVATLSIFYDLIPLFHHRDYLTSDDGRSSYALHARAVARADHVLAISEAVARDATNVLGATRERMSVLYPSLDPLYLAGDAELDASLVPDGPFMVAVTGFHKSKGLRPFLEAYQQLRDHGTDLKLVIVLPEAWTVESVRGWGSHLTAGVDIRAEVPELEKVSLQALARFVVHPSIEEGFGIPMAEAMALEKPIIAADNPLNRELGLHGTLFFDSASPGSLCAALLKLSTDNELLSTLRAAAPQDWAALRPKVTGDFDVMPMLEAALAESRRRVAGDRFALSSTMPPEICGIADYTAELGAAMSAKANVDFFVQSEVTPDLIENSKIGIRPLKSLPAVQHDYNEIFIQLGGSYGFTGQLALLASRELEKPWVTVHDYNMTLGLRQIWQDRLPSRSFLQDVVAAEPEDRARWVAAILLQTDDSTVVDHLDNIPLNSWIMEAAAGVISHLEPPAGSVEPRYEDKVHVFPMGVSDPFQQRYLKPTRRNEKTIIVGTLGNVVRTKMTETIIGAVGRVAALDVDVRLRVVGPQPDPGYMEYLRAVVSQRSLEACIDFVDRVANDQLLTEMRSWDIGVALRDPVRGGMSAALVRLLAIGMPVIMSDIPDWSHVPPDSVVRVRPDRQGEIEPEDTLAAEIFRLATNKSLREQLAEHARAAYIDIFRADVMAANYMSLGR